MWAPGEWPERHKASIRPYAALEEEPSDQLFAQVCLLLVFSSCSVVGGRVGGGKKTLPLTKLHRKKKPHRKTHKIIFPVRTPFYITAEFERKTGFRLVPNWSFLSCSVTLFLFRNSALNELFVRKYEIRIYILRTLCAEKREVEKQQTGLSSDVLDKFQLLSS